MTSSPLPRWAPTPSPTRPSTGQRAMSSCSSSWWKLCGLFIGSVYPPWRRSTQPPLTVGDPTNAFFGSYPLDCIGAGDCSLPEESGGEVFRVFLTWEDLSVTACSGKVEATVILDKISGYARPGEVLALMGPSGCGKTTLLDALAGRLGSDKKTTGNILINGRREKLAFGTSAYVTQETLLMATLTVTEVVHYSAQLQLPDSVPPAEKRERADRAIRQMGLATVCKGISGGQRRRVSICIELLASPALLFLDEPTSGLDSAASFHVMSRIARLAQEERITVVAAMHAPAQQRGVPALP